MLFLFRHVQLKQLSFAFPVHTTETSRQRTPKKLKDDPSTCAPSSMQIDYKTNIRTQLNIQRGEVCLLSFLSCLLCPHRLCGIAASELSSLSDVSSQDRLYALYHADGLCSVWRSCCHGMSMVSFHLFSDQSHQFYRECQLAPTALSNYSWVFCPQVARPPSSVSDTKQRADKF